ncbi:MAG: adenylate/guanylate cyclase domain-containing protein [Chloroflexota bacterium]
MVFRLRLATGLVLFTYVLSHLLNHAAGMVSLSAAESGRLWFLWFWRHPLPTATLYAGLLTHFVLGLYAVYIRRSLKIPPLDLLRVALGLIIPVLIARHFLNTRFQNAVLGVDDTYERMMAGYWVLAPEIGALQVLFVLVAWSHGCIGIHYWLRARPWHAATIPILRVVGMMVPMAALAGFVDMGQEVAQRATDPEWLALVTSAVPAPDAAWIAEVRTAASWSVGALIALVLTARFVRPIIDRRRRGTIRVSYPSGRDTTVVPGTTLLEASRAAGVPHAALCGGRGRCSTCRARIGGTVQALPPPSAEEARVLQRIGAPPNVRLACQVRPVADVAVFPLLPPSISHAGELRDLSGAAGHEERIAILFADLRSYTTLADGRLPFDVVFVLDQYFAAVGGAIERAGGHVDKFIGDGVMALFGIGSSPEHGCRQALAGAVGMIRALDEVNRILAHDLDKPLRMGIGIHVGTVIVGRMGYGEARTLTAIGSAVNIASRLEECTKELVCQIVFSDTVGQTAGLDVSGLAGHSVSVRGLAQPLLVRAVADAESLHEMLGEETPSASSLR